MKKNKNAFTLIELIAVLVILAIIALIVTPLVMNIVKRAKDSANKRSVDAYGKALELSVASYLLEHKEYPDSLLGLKVEYNGNEVVCKTQKLNENGSIYLSGCSVNELEVKDSSTEDGYYHYGKNIDIKSEESIVYKSYNVGDIVTYNDMNFYVIEASDENSDRVTMLKAEPLTVDEVNKYGVGHVNRYTYSSVGTAYDVNGYGGMQYYTSETCGYVNGSYVGIAGCKADYNESDIKYVVDAWLNDKIKAADLKEDSLGYKARLLTFEDLTNNLGYVYEDGATSMNFNSENTPSWVYNNPYGRYWTMSALEDFEFRVWSVLNSGHVFSGGVFGYYVGSDDTGGIVRPVITLLKSSI